MRSDEVAALAVHGTSDKKDLTDDPFVEEEVVGEGSGISHHKIETLLKIVKSHRSALDFDAGFVVKLVTAADFDFEKEVELVSERKKAGVKRKLK